MTAPIPFRVLRYRCPHCPRTASSKTRMVDHIGRCWHNPAARACKTCAHYKSWADGCGCEPGCNWGGDPLAEHCRLGVSLAGRPACKPCGGRGETFDLGDLGASECYECGGDGAEIKPGPIVGCDRWEPDADHQARPAEGTETT